VGQRVRLRVPGNATAGEHNVYVSVGSAIGTPAIGLPLDGHDGRRRYRVGRIRIVAGPNVQKWPRGEMYDDAAGAVFARATGQSPGHCPGIEWT